LAQRFTNVEISKESQQVHIHS